MKDIKFIIYTILLIGVVIFKCVSLDINYDMKNNLNSAQTNLKEITNNIVEDQPIEETVVDEPVYEEEVVVQPAIVYDGMTLEELSAKLDRSLNSTIAGKGELIATKSLELGIDPYLAVAIILHETGCKWNCSSLVKNCNNVGGQKGSPGCNGGAYKSFPTLDDGINGFLENLYKNYYSYGLTTPEAMGPKYAASTSWASKVNSYIETIKAN